MAENFIRGNVTRSEKSARASLMTELRWMGVQYLREALCRQRLQHRRSAVRRDHSKYKELEEGHMVGVKKVGREWCGMELER